MEEWMWISRYEGEDLSRYNKKEVAITLYGKGNLYVGIFHYELSNDKFRLEEKGEEFSAGLIEKMWLKPKKDILDNP